MFGLSQGEKLGLFCFFFFLCMCRDIMQKDGMNRQIAKLWKRCLLLFMAMCAILVEYLQLSKVLLRKQIKIVQFDNL